MTKQLSTVLALAGLAACIDNNRSSNGDFVEAADAVVGIYLIDSHTRNEVACSPGGDELESTLGHEYVVAFRERVLGSELLQIMSCPSPQACRDQVAERTGFPYDFGFTVYDVAGDGSLFGSGSSSGFNDDGTCVEGEVFNTSLTLSGATLRVEQGITVADDYPAEDGVCWTNLAAEAASGNTCSKMEVLVATFVEAL